MRLSLLSWSLPCMGGGRIERGRARERERGREKLRSISCEDGTHLFLGYSSHVAVSADGTDSEDRLTTCTLFSDPARMSAAISAVPNPLQSVARRNGLQGVHHLTAGACEVQLRSHPMARTAKTARNTMKTLVSRNIAPRLAVRRPFARHLP